MALNRKSIPLILSAWVLVCTSAWATSVSVVGLFKDKAIVSIDSGKPRTLSVGQTIDGVKLLAADSGGASFDVDGKRRTLGMGQSFAGGPATVERQSVSLSADARGHFVAAGSLNGYPLSFLVDTGATALAINAAEAQRIGLNYKAGQAVGVSSKSLRDWHWLYAPVPEPCGENIHKTFGVTRQGVRRQSLKQDCKAANRNKPK